MRRKYIKLIGFITLGCTATFAASPAGHSQENILSIAPAKIEAVNQAFEYAIREQGINTAAAAIIKNGKLAWTGYYGDQSLGVAASKTTQFNVGSLTKTVAAETFLMLADKSLVSIDTPMAPYWVDPDIQDDPRHQKITPRMALTHTTGFPNWRFFQSDYKLRLLNDPGTTYGYSGEGFQYLAKYTEKKLGKTFEQLVIENIFSPLSLKHVSFSARQSNFSNIAVAKTETGEVPTPYCRPGNKYCAKEGSYSAAGNMVISLEDYATFLISVMKGENYSPELKQDRNRVQVSRPVKYCEHGTDGCPVSQGYGLGWVVVDQENEKIVWHGGSDWSLVTSAYFYEKSQDGLIIFLNAPNRLAMDRMPELIQLMDPSSPIIDQYQLWAERE